LEGEYDEFAVGRKEGEEFCESVVSQGVLRCVKAEKIRSM
jgi:hypothetical protein